MMGSVCPAVLDAFRKKPQGTTRARLATASEAAVNGKSTTIITETIVAQGTSWVVADTQAFLPSGSIPMRVESQSANVCSCSVASVVLPCACDLHAATSTLWPILCQTSAM
jgi:hypothetical protein